jgi:hypothetical protein
MQWRPMKVGWCRGVHAPEPRHEVGPTQCTVVLRRREPVNDSYDWPTIQLKQKPSPHRGWFRSAPNPPYR